jgi:hypothetical protein
VKESAVYITTSETVIEWRSNGTVLRIMLIGLFISEMFFLIMGREIFCNGICFKNVTNISVIQQKIYSSTPTLYVSATNG